ncbi:MAG: GNAT family N-acetyltransferase [Acetatifactor sp.]|nr:GNAT family N-acetyltransferase [Acetatifactor sp.]
MEHKRTYEEAVEELSLMLMYLTRQHDNNEYCRYNEISWKGYDFDTLEQLDREELIYLPRSSKGYKQYLCLTEAGRTKAQELLKAYGFPDKDLNQRFQFRNILPEEADQAVRIEEACFPPNEACSEKMMRERIARAPELFLVAVDRQSGRIAGFLNGLSTDEYTFRDEFFTDAGLYDPNGRNVMLLGLDVLPEYRRQGLAREIMFQYLRREHERGRNRVVLTCLNSKVKMYKKMGFMDMGLAQSSWGGEQWHEMVQVLNG